MTTTLESSRFASAARSEMRRLGQQRSSLAEKLAAVEARIAELQPFATPDEPDDTGALRGHRIRDIAVELLRAEHGDGPFHYRDGLRLLESRGYRVAGKRPEAVFLNQLVRSPLVRATTQRGYYLVGEAA
jgi:vacuolar-type H+-ATPase subunit I/STV1